MTGLTILADKTGYQWDVNKSLLGTTGKDFPSWWDNRPVRWKKNCSHPFPSRLECDDVIFGGVAAISSYKGGHCQHIVGANLKDLETDKISEPPNQFWDHLPLEFRLIKLLIFYGVSPTAWLSSPRADTNI